MCSQNTALLYLCNRWYSNTLCCLQPPTKNEQNQKTGVMVTQTVLFLFTGYSSLPNEWMGQETVQTFCLLECSKPKQLNVQEFLRAQKNPRNDWVEQTLTPFPAHLTPKLFVRDAIYFSRRLGENQESTFRASGLRGVLFGTRWHMKIEASSSCD